MYSILESLKPDLKAVVYASAALLGNLIWSIYRGRRSAVTWTAVFQPIKPQGPEPSSAKVAIMVNDRPALNLQYCQIALVNDSSRDIENMDVLISFQSPFAIVDAQAGLSTSGKSLLISESFRKTTDAVFAMPEGTRSTSPAFEYILRGREFHIPALNRGDTATCAFWINSPHSSDKPFVNTTTEKVGVKMISVPADIRPLNAARVRAAVRIGVPICLAVTYCIALLNLHPYSTAFLSALAGMLCGVVGFALIDLFKWLRRMF